MMEMKEQTGSRKKYLVPVVVLMLCLVALTGAAYAYSSTLTNSANTVEAKSLTLDFNGEGATASDLVTDVQIVTFTDNFGYAGLASKTNDIKVQYVTANIAVYKIKVTGDADQDTFNVSSSNLAALKPYASFGDNTTTMGSLFTFTYMVGTEAGDASVVAARALGSAATVTLTKDTAYFVTVVATAASTTPAVIEHVADAYDENANTAADYATAIDGLSFTLTLEASKA